MRQGVTEEALLLLCFLVVFFLVLSLLIIGLVRGIDKKLLLEGLLIVALGITYQPLEMAFGDGKASTELSVIVLKFGVIMSLAGVGYSLMSYLDEGTTAAESDTKTSSSTTL